jgi:signal transduction histidine kinase
MSVPSSADASAAHRAHALAASLAERCRADAVVLLARESANWRVMAVAGSGVRRIRPGDLFSSAQNPSLSPETGAGRPDLPSDAEPFLAALGPIALGDWITCPVVAGGTTVGFLHLVTSWTRPFGSGDVEEAAEGAGMAASLLADDLPSAAAPPQGIAPALHGELVQATSLLNHDLRSPLNAILGFADMLAQGNCDTQQVVHYAGIIAAGGESLQDMLDRVVAQMRIVLEVYPWHPERAPVGAFLAGFPASGDLGGIVHWDTAAVADACRALLGNVAGAGGEATVAVEVRGDLVHLAFGARPREEADLDPDFGGVGAQFARHVFAAHGGTVRVGGSGAWFGVLLPAEPPRFA